MTFLFLRSIHFHAEVAKVFILENCVLVVSLCLSQTKRSPPQQHCQRKGDSRNLSGGKYPDRPVCVHAAHSAAVDPKACPVRPLPVCGGHFA